MKNKKSAGKIPLTIYRNITEIMSKAYKASAKVLEENKRMGVASPFSLKGKIYHLMPDGRILLRSSQSDNKRIYRGKK